MPAAAEPGLGHNQPPRTPLIALDLPILRLELEEAVAQHRQRRDQLLQAADRFHAAHARITDDDVQQRATDFVRQMSHCLKAVEGERTFQKRPIIDAQRAIDGFFSGFTSALSDAMTAIERMMTAYASERARAAREKAARDAERLRAEAAEAERQALANRASLDAAISASEAADAAVRMAAAKPADLSRVHSDLGGVSSLRAIVRHRVVDLDAVPRKYLQVDDALVKFAGKGWRHGQPQPIPGIEFYVEEKVTVR